MTHEDDVRIEVYVYLPWAKERGPFRAGYMVDAATAHRALTPLPREREIDRLAMIEASEQRRRRRDVVGTVSRVLAETILQACEAEDTENGYRRG